MILLFVALLFFRLAADSDVVEDASGVALVNETGDSCIIHQSLDRATDTYSTPDTIDGPIIEVKWENYPDVKMEDMLGSVMACQDFSVKVRVSGILIVMCLRHAAYNVLFFGYRKN